MDFWKLTDAQRQVVLTALVGYYIDKDAQVEEFAEDHPDCSPEVTAVWVNNLKQDREIAKALIFACSRSKIPG